MSSSQIQNYVAIQNIPKTTSGIIFILQNITESVTVTIT